MLCLLTSAAGNRNLTPASLAEWRLEAGNSLKQSAALEGEFSGPDINRFKEDHGFQLNHIGGNIYTARGMDLPGLQSLAEFDTVTEIEASIYTEQPHGRAGPLV